jgi:hypothetical protein
MKSWVELSVIGCFLTTAVTFWTQNKGIETDRAPSLVPVEKPPAPMRLG